MSERTVVAVEDEAAIADAPAARLRAEGFAVEVAADGGDIRVERAEPRGCRMVVELPAAA